MTRRYFASVLGALTALLLLAGCITSRAPTQPAPVHPATPPKPIVPETVSPVTAPVTPAPAPTPIVEPKPSTIMGSEETSAMFDNFTAYIHAIDGQAVFGGRSSWDIPLPLKPGQRQLTIAFIRGVFTAQTQVQLKVRPDAAYRLKFESDAHVFGKNSYCEFWIEDTATGWKVVPPTRVPLTKAEPAK